MLNKIFKKGFNRKHKNILLQIIVVAIVFVCLQILFYKSQILEVEKEINSIGKDLTNELEQNIEGNSEVLMALGYNFYLDNSISEDKFNRLAQYYIQKFPDILYLQHKNKETVTDMVYPLKGNEGTLGKSLKNRPETKNAVDEAIQNRKVTINNPYELKFLEYKTLGVVMRYPIFRNNEFDGFFVAIIDLNKFLSHTISEELREKYDISIYDSSGKAFYKIGNEQRGYIYEDKVKIEDNYWTIDVGLRSNYRAKIMLHVVLFSLLGGTIFVTLFYMEHKIVLKDRNINDLTILQRNLREEIENRKIIEEDLSKLAAIIESSSDAILGLDLDGNIITWNAGAEKIYGYKEKEIKGKNVSQLIPENKLAETVETLDSVRCGKTVNYFETERIRKDKEEIHVSTTISPIRDRNEEIIGFSEIAKDITEHKIMEQDLQDSYEELSAVYQQLTATEEELRAQFDELQINGELLRKSEQRYELVISASLDGIYDWDIKNNDIYHSKSWKRMMDYGDDENVSNFYESWKNRIHPEDRERVLDELDRYLNREIEDFRIEYRIRKSGGTYIWAFDNGIAVWDKNGSPVRMAGTIKNINDRKRWEEKIYSMAYYDPLTNLPNRVLFEEKLNYALMASKENLGKGAVFFIDLDNFKNINDTLGHEFGDNLIIKVGNELQSCVEEQGVVTRFGGDEFLILQSEISSSNDATDLANKILNIFNKPWIIGEHQIYTTASIGIAVFPEDGIDVNEILKNADTAMYKAKGSGKNKFQFFQRLMSFEILRKTEISNALRNALKNNEFELYYQPLLELKTGKIGSFEALIRWNHPEWGFVPPNEFIPIAEETGLIIPIGEWVLRTACKQNKEWKDRGYSYNSIAVNVSAVQLQQRNFLCSIKEILEECNLEPQFLELEITESVLMKYIDWNIETLSGLQNMGVKIAIDDFGTGYSSLNYLKSLPIDSVKIDKSFIDGICMSANEESIVEGIILLAHKMQLEVVAEGVEVKEQLEILGEKRCDKIQGYYISKPYPAEEIEKLINSKSCDFS
ncbi:EAL domain-containing protein [Wukongibacter baidiensis]|uniref:EAL domain-containing protein n=1 Tax=Wukongibacter baidiensis TaxID=1723361 RepID=UPI003D7FE43E